MEIVGAPRRMFTGMMIQVFFAVGVCYVALVSFLLKSWQYINLAVVIPTVFYLSYWWYVLTVLCVWVLFVFLNIYSYYTTILTFRSLLCIKH